VLSAPASESRIVEVRLELARCVRSHGESTAGSRRKSDSCLSDQQTYAILKYRVPNLPLQLCIAPWSEHTLLERCLRSISSPRTWDFGLELMHATIQNMIYLVARAFSRCQEHEETGHIKPKSSGVPLAQENVHERNRSFGGILFHSFGFLWLKLQNMLRANQRLKSDQQPQSSHTNLILR